MLTEETLRRAPKALLHDHLDGGLRPQTIIELADTVGYQGLPAHEAGPLGAWFRDSADGGVYAEVRYAPELHLVEGLSLEDVVEAVNAGFRDGERIAAASGRDPLA